MTQRNQPLLDALAESTVARLLLVIGTTLVLAAASPLIFLTPLANFPWVSKYAIAIGLGIAAAMAARFILAHHTFVLKFLAALVSLTAGLFLLKHLSSGYIGVASNPAAVIDWDGLAQLGLATAMAWLVLRTGRKSIRPQKKAITSKPVKLGEKPKSVLQKVKIPSSTGKIKKSPANPSNSSKKSGARTTVAPAFLSLSTWNKSWANSLKRMRKTIHRLRVDLGRVFLDQSKWAIEKLPRLRGKANHQRSSAISPQSLTNLSVRDKKPRSAARQVRLLSDEEHRCPYCLEMVLENDPRGVKICPICGTHHHADCWAVTGVCQVPHQHE
ncbi:MAG: hypothetical protein N3D16_08115 [Anaerolineales bacterium]|nr:hypothetical protein [Anaerolineales bacterium]